MKAKDHKYNPNADNSASLKKAVIAWRGEIPAECDFCGRLRPERELHPEESGMWICSECIKRIGY